MTAAARRFAGKVAVVSAAGNGIGRAAARRLSAEGAAVLVTDIDAPAARHVAQGLVDLGCDADSIELDATDPEHWRRARERVVGRWGGVDVAVLNAGLNVPGRIESIDLPGWHSQLRLNLDSVFLGVHTLLPDLTFRRGSVVITSSIHAVLGFPGFPGYAAAKGAIAALVRQLAVDNGTSVRFNAVAPGAIDSTRWSLRGPAYREAVERSTPMRRLGSADEVAAAIAFLAGDDASFVTGQSLVVDGGRTITANEEGFEPP